MLVFVYRYRVRLVDCARKGFYKAGLVQRLISLQGTLIERNRLLC